MNQTSFDFLGYLICNVLYDSLQIAETGKLIEQMVLLVRSTLYFGYESEGKTTTLFMNIKNKLYDYPKINQKNFWQKWFDIEVKTKGKEDSMKQNIILDICSRLLEIEVSKIITKYILEEINKKAFGKESEIGKETQKLFMKKITSTKYTNQLQI